MHAPKALSIEPRFTVRLRDGTERKFVCYDFADIRDGRFVFFDGDLEMFELTTRDIAEIDFRSAGI